MDICHIPFNTFMQISPATADGRTLCLEFRNHLSNHLGSLHAGAQFALAEASSGLALQHHFPHLAAEVVPVLRKSEIKFKNPALSALRARSTIAPEAMEKFAEQLQKKGRATITVAVELIDQQDKATLTGSFEWFIQQL